MLEGYLDIMYGKGEGVPEDDVKGYSWMNLSAHKETTTLWRRSYRIR